MSVDEIGKYVVLADGSGVWDLPGRHLTVNLNGPLQGQDVGQLVLDIPNIICTFLWDELLLAGLHHHGLYRRQLKPLGEHRAGH